MYFYQISVLAGWYTPHQETPRWPETWSATSSPPWLYRNKRNRRKWIAWVFIRSWNDTVLLTDTERLPIDLSNTLRILGNVLSDRAQIRAAGEGDEVQPSATVLRGMLTALTECHLHTGLTSFFLTGKYRIPMTCLVFFKMSVSLHDPGEGHKPKHAGLLIKLLFMLQVLLKVWSLQTCPSPCTLIVDAVVPETATLF